MMVSQIETPIGSMFAIGDSAAVHALCFRLEKNDLPFGKTRPLLLVEQELLAYFAGTLQEFTTPLFLKGTPFQKKVWEELRKIPFGKTKSYKEIAEAIQKPTACRAVAQANKANPFAIIIPCHRVIQHDGRIGGYNSGLNKKRRLLLHEQAK